MVICISPIPPPLHVPKNAHDIPDSLLVPQLALDGLKGALHPRRCRHGQRKAVASEMERPSLSVRPQRVLEVVLHANAPSLVEKLPNERKKEPEFSPFAQNVEVNRTRESA